MQAIVTKYVPATSSKPSRIKATCESGSTYVSYSYDFDEYGCHHQAAQALCLKMGWTNAAGYAALVGGALPKNAGYAWIFSHEEAYKSALGEMVDRASMAYPHFESGPGLELVEHAKAVLKRK